jgi:hypothetical protein
MVPFRITWFQIAATAAWIAVLSGGMGFGAAFARHDDRVVSQVRNDGSAPFHIAFLAPNELGSSDEIEGETHEIDQEICDGSSSSSLREGAFERRRPHAERRFLSPPSFRFSARGPPRC